MLLKSISMKSKIPLMNKISVFFFFWCLMEIYTVLYILILRYSLE